MTDSRPDRCETCRFWDRSGFPLDPGLSGTCHRYAPRADAAFSWTTHGFPDIGGLDWCGEWEGKGRRGMREAP